MRSTIIVSALIAFFSFACGGSSDGVTTAAHTTTENKDAGTGTTTSKPIPIKPAPATPSEEKDAGVMPDPTPDLLPTCKGAALCINECPDNDEPCYAACMKGMPSEELTKFEAVGTCINTSECETDECIEQTCASEIQACLGE